MVKHLDVTHPECLQKVKTSLWEHKMLLIPASEMAFNPNARLVLGRLWGDVEQPPRSTRPTHGSHRCAVDLEVRHMFCKMSPVGMNLPSSSNAYKRRPLKVASHEGISP